MNQVVFVRKFSTSRCGTSATVIVYSKESFIDGEVGFDRDNILYCEFGKFSKPMNQMTLEKFREIFSSEEILMMMANGILNYNSSEKQTHKKYPMFKAEIYKKYGIDTSK